VERLRLISIVMATLFISNVFAQSYYQPDLNGDKFVNFSDFRMLADNWRKSGSNLTGDIDSSGTVDIADLAGLAEKWLRYSLVIFVDADASPGGDGTSWENAFIYLQDAIADADEGYQIWAAQGIYRPDANSNFPNGTGLRTSTFQIPQGIAIYGGFPTGGGTLQERDWINNETILSGDIGIAGSRNDNCYNVVVGANDVVLDGLVISYGNATATGDSARGGGMRNEDVNNITIANCTFRDNYARYDGGGIYNYQSSVSFINCIFSENNCGDDGAGVYNSNTDAALTNCSFFDNHSANRGGGIYNYQTPAELIDCLFSGNAADANGGAVYNGYKAVKLINCTIAENSAAGNTGGIYNTYSSSNIINCVVWDSGIAIYNHSCNPHISYCDIQNCGTSGVNWNPNFGEDDGNNIDIDPCFADELALKAESLCIDAGKNFALPLNITTDIKGNARFNKSVDMGAYEYGQLDMTQDTDNDGMPDWWEFRFFLDPNDANDALTDLDEDGLLNLNEYENNCDAAFFDTDGDLLPDGWEVLYGLNPLNSDVVEVVDGDNVYADNDDDGLDTLEEIMYSCSPLNSDSDGDGTNDGAEVTQGSLPMDATDLGLPPSADEICELRLTVGDWSNSNSERYDLKIGPITHQATEFGVVETADYRQFRPGRRYEVRILHRGTDPSRWWYPNADYDYVAQIEAVSLPAGVVMQIEDTDGILGYHGEPNTMNGVFDAAGKVAYVNLIKVEVSGINFDHSSGDESDGISIYDAGIPEWAKEVQNDPAAYKKNTSVTIKAKFTVSPTSVTSAKICATTTDPVLGNLGERIVNFSYGESEYVTFTPSNSTSSSISKNTVTWQWKAKDLNGGSLSEYNINVSGPHTVYTVYDSPKCSVSNFTMNNLDGAVGKALGENTEAGVASKANSNVSHNLFSGCICEYSFQTNFDAAMGNFPTTGDKGMCCCRAKGLDCVLNVLGIGPYTQIFCNEMPESGWATSRHSCVGTCSVHRDILRCYYASNGYNNWEGAIRSGGDGTTAYAPGGGTFEDTYDGIADNWPYYWIHWDEELGWQPCSGSCGITGNGSCSSHSSYWGRFE